jgi:hypothetical protein
LTRGRTGRRSWVAAFALLAWLAGPVQAETPGSTVEAASPAARTMAEWAVASGDTRGRPFIVVDKLAARVFAFDAAGGLVSETPALMGAAVGDESPAGIGTLALAEIGPAMRITPAGRYEAQLGRNIAGHSILWVDYDTALSLHAVVTGNARERRLERLATTSILDNRISYGCINVPARFYEDIVEPLFTPAGGMAYILPEASSVRQIAAN